MDFSNDKTKALLASIILIASLVLLAMGGLIAKEIKDYPGIFSLEGNIFKRSEKNKKSAGHQLTQDEIKQASRPATPEEKNSMRVLTPEEIAAAAAPAEKKAN